MGKWLPVSPVSRGAYYQDTISASNYNTGGQGHCKQQITTWYHMELHHYSLETEGHNHGLGLRSDLIWTYVVDHALPIEAGRKGNLYLVVLCSCI